MSLLFRELLIQWNGKDFNKCLLVTDQKLPKYDLYGNTEFRKEFLFSSFYAVGCNIEAPYMNIMETIAC
jgi:hypothetical protein